MAPPLVLAAGVALFAQGLEPVSARSPSVAEKPAEPDRSARQSIQAPNPADGEANAELFLKLQAGDTIGKLLDRAGVTRNEAMRAEALVASAIASAVPSGTDVAILLGDGASLRRLTLRTGLELKLVVTRDGNGGLRLTREDIEVDSTPLRFRGRSGAGLYWSMRASGVPAEVAAEYLAVVGQRLGLSRQPGPNDRFDLIVAHRRALTGESRTGPLLYAAIDRPGGSDLQLVNWSVGERSGWFDANRGNGHSAGLVRPVRGPVTSGFGTRVHPILRFARIHRGVDFGAPWGSSIVAAADGRVVGAGWNRGHGRQVRIAHPNGLETSYSHMSKIAAEPGSFVRQGQLIGYVGSTGFSTGPHLHYEIRDRGRVVDPLLARHSYASALGKADIVAIRARLRQLLAIDGSRIASLPATAASS